MSYRFTISFCEVKDKADAFDKALSLVKYYQSQQGKKQGISEILRNIRICDKELIDCDEFIENLINKKFRFNFIYFKKHNILGYVGTFQTIFPTNICFQNQVDHNYDFEVWKGISLFEQIIEKCKKLSAKEIAEKLDDQTTDVYAISKNPQYYIKTLVYEEISKTLNIKDWIARSYNNNYFNYDFDSFVLSAIDDPVDMTTLKFSLRKALKENLTYITSNQE